MSKIFALNINKIFPFIGIGEVIKRKYGSS